MTVTLTDIDKKRILETLTIEECEEFIGVLKDEVDLCRKSNSEDSFVVEAIKLGRIKYYRLAIKLIEDTTEKEEHVSFDVTDEEIDTIIDIVKRIDSYIPVKDIKSRTMDIAACHCNGCKLDLNKLLKFDKGSLLHDITGITVCLDRTTGKLRNGFRPRSAIDNG